MRIFLLSSLTHILGSLKLYLTTYNLPFFRDLRLFYQWVWKKLAASNGVEDGWRGTTIDQVGHFGLVIVVLAFLSHFWARYFENKRKMCLHAILAAHILK